MAVSVKGRELSRMLKRVYLGGIVKECVFATDPNASAIQAVDLTSSLYIHVEAQFSLGEDSRLGIGDIQLLTKYLDSVGDDEVSIETIDNRLICKHSGTFKYLLTQADMIPTAPEPNDSEETDTEQMVEPCNYRVTLSDEFRKEFLGYMGLIKPKSIIISTTARGSVRVAGGLESDHQFELQVGRLTNLTDATCKKFDEVNVEVYGEHIKAVLDAIDLSTEPAFMSLNPEEPKSPLIISQASDFWGLMPVGDLGGE